MNLNKTIVMSAIAAAMLGLTGCGGGGADTGAGTYTASTTTTATTTTTTVIDPALYDGLGAADVSERHIANDATPLPFPAYDAANVENLFGDITVNTLLTNNKQWKLSGLVTVKNGATLTIEPGTVVFGDSIGDDYLVITKGSKIIADGTPANPIIFTSETALMDPTQADVGQWGGLTVLGAAPTNHADPFYEVDELNPDFSFGNAVAGAGDPADERTDISAMIDEDNAQRVEEWVKEAVEGGAKVLAGGKRDGGYFEPTVLTNTDTSMKVCSLEIFGPVVTIEKYKEFNRALEYINNSRYGLQAGVFTNKINEMNQAFRHLEVGGIMINDIPGFRVDHMPYGGVKDSGFGREGVKYSIHHMMEPRLLVKNK